MKQLKKRIKIVSVDETAGRVLVDANGVVEGTGIAVYLDGQLWGTGEVAQGQALVMGQNALPSTYSLTLEVHTVNTKLLSSE